MADLYRPKPLKAGFVETIDHRTNTGYTELSHNFNVWHTATIFCRKTGTTFDIKLPYHALKPPLFTPEEWGELDNAVMNFQLRGVPTKRTNAFLTLRYLAIFCPYNYLSDTADASGRTFVLGYLILARVSILLQDAWKVISSIKSKWCQHEARQFAVAELAVLRIVLDDVLLALQRGTVKPLIVSLCSVPPRRGCYSHR